MSLTFGDRLLGTTWVVREVSSSAGLIANHILKFKNDGGIPTLFNHSTSNTWGQLTLTVPIESLVLEGPQGTGTDTFTITCSRTKLYGKVLASPTMVKGSWRAALVGAPPDEVLNYAYLVGKEWQVTSVEDDCGGLSVTKKLSFQTNREIHYRDPDTKWGQSTKDSAFSVLVLAGKCVTTYFTLTFDGTLLTGRIFEQPPFVLDGGLSGTEVGSWTAVEGSGAEDGEGEG